MSLVYDDDERMLLDAARDFLRAESPVSALRALRDSADATGFSRELWASMAGMGWAGLLVPEVHGVAEPQAESEGEAEGEGETVRDTVMERVPQALADGEGEVEGVAPVVGVPVAVAPREGEAPPEAVGGAEAVVEGVVSQECPPASGSWTRWVVAKR